MSKDKVTNETVGSDVVEMPITQREWKSCQSLATDGFLQGKVLATKLALIDKIKEGIDNGHNCEYLCQLSVIYSNLSF